MSDTDPPLIFWGRCRSGRRWFWTASEHGGEQIHGWAASPDEASRQANVAAVQLAAGRYANIRVLHGAATEQLKKLNAAKRATAQPKAKGPRKGPVPPAEPIGYLYGIDHGGEYNDFTTRLVRFPITKKTAKRIYYIRRDRGDGDMALGFVDRQEMEARGEVWRGCAGWWEPDCRLSAEPPELQPRRPAEPDLKALKAAMADAHPDRGGTNEAFIAARQQYLRAKQRTFKEGLAA